MIRRPTGNDTPQPPDAADLQAVCNAYRAVHRHGKDHAAFQAAVEVYMHRHPDVSEGDAIAETSRLLDHASRLYGHWLYGRDEYR